MQQTEHNPYRASAALLFLLTGLFWFSQYTTAPYLNPEMKLMGATPAFMGLVAGVYGFTQLVVRIPIGIMADRMGRQKPFIVMGCLMAVISAAGMLLYYHPNGFFIFRGIAGIGSGSWVSFTVLYGSYYPTQEAPRRISQLSNANHMGRLICFVVMGALVTWYAIKAAFWAGLVTAVIALVMSLFIREVPRKRAPMNIRHFLTVARDENLKATSILGALIQVISFGTFYTFTVNLAVELNATPAELSFLNIALMLPLVIANLVATKWLFSRIGARMIITLGFLMAALYCMLAPLAANMTQLFLVQALAGIGFSFTFSILLGQCVRTVTQDMRSVGMGLFQAVYGVGMTIGPVLMGYLIRSSGLKNSYFVMAAVSLLSAWLAYRLLKEPKPA